jgi:hypothetical protein
MVLKWKLAFWSPSDQLHKTRYQKRICEVYQNPVPKGTFATNLVTIRPMCLLIDFEGSFLKIRRSQALRCFQAV